MRKLYLIRHGQCRDGAHRCIGGTDLPLDEVGLCQAERLRQWARSKPLTAVYTSPLSRCRETARILSDGRLPVHTADGLREMDGGVFSWKVQMIKPDEGIYRRLLETYGLKAEECVFMDDNPANVETAKRLGIQGIVFTGYEETRQKLEEMLRA